MNKATTAFPSLSCFLIIFFIVLILIIQPTMESRTFNKLTGAKTTAWDALWVELRVQETTAPRK